MQRVKTNEIQSIDASTGEVLSKSTTNVITFPREPAYVKMYIEDLCSLAGVEEADQALLRHLLARLDYEGYVVLTPRVRDAISAQLAVKSKTLRNRLSRLVAADMIKPVARNEYKVNPNYFARGDWKSVCEQRLSYSMTVTYSEAGRKITTTHEGDAHKQQELI